MNRPVSTNPTTAPSTIGKLRRGTWDPNSINLTMFRESERVDAARAAARMIGLENIILDGYGLNMPPQRSTRRNTLPRVLMKTPIDF